MCNKTDKAIPCESLNMTEALISQLKSPAAAQLGVDLAEVNLISFALAASQIAAGESALRCLCDLHACLQTLMNLEGIILNVVLACCDPGFNCSISVNG